MSATSLLSYESGIVFPQIMSKKQAFWNVLDEAERFTENSTVPADPLLFIMNLFPYP